MCGLAYCRGSTGAVLERLGALDHIGDREALALLSSLPILNSRGIPVGYLAAAGP